MQAILGWLASIFIDRLIGAIVAFFKGLKRDADNHKKNADQAAQETKKAEDLKPDATTEETDDAIDDTFSRM